MARGLLIACVLVTSLGLAAVDARAAERHEQRQATISVSLPGHALAGQLVLASGKVAHVPHGAVVVLERRSGSSWVRVGHASATHGHFRLSFVLPASAGTLRLRAAVLKGRRRLASSHIVSLSVHRVGSSGVKGFGPTGPLALNITPPSSNTQGNGEAPSAPPQAPSPAPLSINAPAATLDVGSVVQVGAPAPLTSLSAIAVSVNGAEPGVGVSLLGSGLEVFASAGAQIQTMTLTVTGTGCTGSECGRAFVISLPVSVVSMAATPGVLETFTHASPDRISQASENKLDDELLIVLGSSEMPGTRAQAEAAASAVGAVVSGGLDEDGIYQLRWATPQNLPTRIAELQAQPNVTSAGPSFVGVAEDQTAYRPTVAAAYDFPQWTWRYDQVQAAQAWAQSTGSGVKVGILDLGDVYAPSPDLSQVTTLDPILVPGAHATHLAGLACGKPNGGGMVGMAWGCPIVSTYPWGNSDADYLEAMNRLAKTPGVRVVNMSVGAQSGCADQALRGKIEEWVSDSQGRFARFFQRGGANIVWTFSAGNNCMSGADSPWAADFYLPNVIAVAAANDGGTLASFSDYDVPVAAPGGVVPRAGDGIDLNASCASDQVIDNGACGLLSSTVVACPEGYCPARGEMAGTSMAAPMVAGIAALVAAKHPTFKAPEIEHCITSTAATGGVGSTAPPDGQPGGRYAHPKLPYTGHPIPIVNAAAAVQCPTEIPTVQATAMGPTSGPAGFGMRVSAASCQYLAVSFDDSSGYIESYYSQTSSFEPVTTPNLTKGQHQMSFACQSAPNGSVIWMSPGFAVTVTGGPTPVALTASTVEAGGDLTYLSGPSLSPSTCPTLPGVSPYTLSLFLDSPDGLAVTASRFVAMPDNAVSETLNVPAGTPADTYTALERCYYYGSGGNGVFEFAYTYRGVTVADETSSSSSAASTLRRHTPANAPVATNVLASSKTSGTNTPPQIISAPLGPQPVGALP
jgi:hypothetical protein